MSTVNFKDGIRSGGTLDGPGETTLDGKNFHGWDGVHNYIVGIARFDERFQAADAGLSDIAAIAPTDGTFMVGDGAAWVGESGADARDSLELGAADDVAFAGLTLAPTASNAVAILCSNLINGDVAFRITEIDTIANSVFLIEAYDSYGIVRIQRNNSDQHVISSSGGIVFNEQGYSLADFRVESSSQPNAIFLDASTNALTIEAIATLASGAVLGTPASGDLSNCTSTNWDAKLDAVLDDPLPTLGGALNVNQYHIHFDTSETVTDGDGTLTIDLTTGNHQTLDLSSSIAGVTASLTTPTGPAAGTIIVKQHATTPVDIFWLPAPIWLGTEPDWASDTAGSYRIVSWRWDGANIFLSSTPSNS